MRTEPLPWKHATVLVCTNQRAPDAPKSSCGRERGAALREFLKGELRAGGGAGAECRVLATGCLDVCSPKGVTVTVVPGSQVWVVDPEADRDALLGEVRAAVEKLAVPEPRGGLRAAARRALGRLAAR